MFLVTGASGALFGRPVLAQLRRLVPEAEIVAGTRDPDSAPELAAAGFKTRRVDFDDPGSLASAFVGAAAVLINGTNYGTPVERRGGQHAAAIRAAVDAGVQRIVYTSWPDPDLFPQPLMSDFAGSEALLRSLSPDATILRTTYGLAQTVGRDVTTAAARGVLAAPAGRARTAPAHIDDLAEAAARVLATDEHRGKLYTLTAGDTIDWTDLARLAATISGTPVEYQPVTDDQFTAAVTAQGIPADLASLLLGVYHAFRAGWTGTPTGQLATILRRAPRPALDAVSAAVAS
ncbi:MAG TPA: NAD(P)H-binding protein [Trebonia sp.]|jgi:NAD(P)H dehydrogenase (quinone)|nr:NAD(P)H-binding protein [Trebonia sp.]